jgi:signal transduction histidine kinase
MSVIACDISGARQTVITHVAMSSISGEPGCGTSGGLARLVEATAHIVWSTTPDGRLDYFSPGWSKLFGLATSGEALAPRILARLHGSDRQNWQDRWIAALADGEPYEVEYRLQRDGEPATWYFERGMPVCLTGGPKPDAWLMTATPLDRHKHCEQTLRDMVSRRDDFFATLMHELRNPLAPIANALQSLAMAKSDRSSVDSMRGIIERQVRQLTCLVDDLLDVARIIHGKVELQLRSVDLAEVIAAAIEAARPVIELRQHALTLNKPAHPVVPQADPVRLTQVLTNLLINAAKYTNPGGHIWLSSEQEGSLAIIHVRDDGVGIPPEKLSEVFELFARADPQSPSGGSGLGVGLTVSRQLIELHGGSICARSEGPGRGSEFIVKLPLVRRASRSQ